MLEIHWTEGDDARSAIWRSENGSPPPANVVIADDQITADIAYRLACEGTALLWHGNFHQARLLLRAIARRAERRAEHRAEGRAERRGERQEERRTAAGVHSAAHAFHLHREERSRLARTLGRLLVPVDDDYTVPLRRAPDVRQACMEVYGPATGPSVMALRELLGVVGAHEWRRKGIHVPALNDRIHPHYGVFSPTRGEYIDLVADAPLATRSRAFDIGTGTGVLAAVLARRGVQHLVATDLDPRAVACARDNLERLELAGRVDVLRADLFPPGRAPLIVCNPPWIPAKPASPLDHAVYDPEGQMVRGFLDGLAEHLEPGGEGWLILSDLAEHLGLRSRGELLAAFAAGGLRVVDRLEARPRHRRASDAADPLHAARAAEVTSLWRLSPHS